MVLMTSELEVDSMNRKRSADIQQTLEENKDYISKKQKIRLKKKSRNAQINEEHEGTLAPHECPLCATEGALFYHFGHETNRFYYKCGKCFLIFVPRSSYLSLTDEASRYALHNNDIEQEGYRFFLNRTVEPLAALLKETQSEWDSSNDPTQVAISKLGVDFGCGPGPSISILMKEHGYDVINYDPQFFPHPDVDPSVTSVPVNIDISKVSKDQSAQSDVSDTNIEGDVALSNEVQPVILPPEILFAQPALSKQYRFITCTEVIEHVKTPMDVWSQLYKMLAPGGVLAVMTGVVDNEQMFQGWHYHRDPTHICFYHKNTLTFVEELFDWKMTRPSKSVTFFTKPKSPSPDSA